MIYDHLFSRKRHSKDIREFALFEKPVAVTPPTMTRL